MSDLIDRDAALNQIIAVDISIIPYAKAREYVNELKNYVIKIIETLPSAESERKKGEWIKEDLSGYLTPGGNSIYHCSECGHKEGPWPHPRLTNFCPSCGADMRGE